MKDKIHPKYYPDAVVRCTCGNSWTTGSTVPELRTDVCSACHPFFTGEQRIVDTEGRVDRFYRRLEQASQLQEEGSPAEATAGEAPAGEATAGEAPAEA